MLPSVPVRRARTRAGQPAGHRRYKEALALVTVPAAGFPHKGKRAPGSAPLAH